MNSKVAIAAVLVIVVSVGAAAGLLLIGSEPGDPSFSVVYDGNGGECGVEDDREYRDGDTAEVMFSPQPTKPGYIFMGWSADKDGGKLDFSKNSDRRTVLIDGGDVRMYAVYKPDPNRLAVGTYMVLDADVSVEGHPSINAVGNMRMDVVSKSDGFYTMKTEISVDLMDGFDRVDSLHQEQTMTTKPTDYSETDFIDYRYGTYLYKDQSVPVVIYKVQDRESRVETSTYYQGLYEDILYCMTLEYAPGSYMEGMKFTFTLTDYETRYDGPEDNGRYHVFYDGNGGVCDAGDGNTYNEGDKVTVRFDTVPYKEGYRFCGWSADSGSEYPEYENALGNYTMTMGPGDVTLYAVYSKYLDKAGVGSTFDYEVRETLRDTPGYLCEVRATAEIAEVHDGGIVYKVTGTRTLTEDGKETVERIDETFDTRNDWWGYNDGDMELVGTEMRAFTIGKDTLPAFWMDYDGVDYYETCTDVYGYYDDLLYSSTYESDLKDGDKYTVVVKLTGFEMV